MPSTNQLLAFVVASILFIQVPGPSLLFTIGRALTVGRRDALLSVVGNTLGLVAQVAGVALGLGALVAASATAYTSLKLVGAAYVVWLGIQAIRHRADARLAMTAVEPAAGTSGRRAVAVGVDRRPGRRHQPQDHRLLRRVPAAVHRPGRSRGAAAAAARAPCSGCSRSASDSCWALAAGRARDWFARKPQRLDRLGATGGVMMVGLGATLATTGSATH